MGTGVMACTLDPSGYRAGGPPLIFDAGSGGQGGEAGWGGQGGMAGLGGIGGLGGLGGGAPEVCGDGKVGAGEGCDDDNANDGDGCSACAVDIGYVCTGEPSLCIKKPPIIALTLGTTAINDSANHYDGSVASMDCLPILVAAAAETQIIQDIELKVAIDHPWLGDLILKLVTPDNIPLTLMLKPGANESSDDYAETPDGDSSNLSQAHPIVFKDTAAVSAESMGNSINPSSTVCKDDGICEFAPAPGKGPGKNLADFRDKPAAGTWSLCAADGDDGDSGTLVSGEMTIWVQ